MSGIKRVVPRLASIAFKMNFADLVSEIKPVGFVVAFVVDLLSK